MGSGSSSESKATSDKNNNVNNKTPKPKVDVRADPEDEKIDIDEIEKGYPPPKPPRNKKEDVFKKEDFAAIDKRSREAPLSITKNWQEFLDYLVKDCKTDIQKLRSLFIWLGSVNANQVPNPIEPSSPGYLIRKLSLKEISYGVVFTHLCRKAKLPCVLIRGNGKSAAYEVGDSSEKVGRLQNNWNAVYVDGDWRLVVPLWACQVIVGHSTGRYTLVEAQGQAVRQKESAAQGIVVKHINEYYFLTNPDELVFDLLASDPQWQLLKEPFSLEKFCSVPYVYEKYFTHKLEIKSDFTCRYYAVDGKCHIAIQAKIAKWNGILKYRLYFNNDESQNSIPDDLQLDKYVIMERSSNQLWTFIIRFPVAGVYKMEIIGGPEGDISSICDFKLFCDTAMENVRPLPCNPGVIGFGPTPKLESVGLTSPSQSGGIIVINKNQQVNLSFGMKQEVSIRTELVHNEITSEKLQENIDQKVVNNKLQVNVKVPEPGEYALRMYVKDKETNTEENVCNYLLSSDDIQKKKKTRENPTEKRTRENLINKIDTANNPADLEEAIKKFNKLHMDDKGDLSRAMKRKTFLELQKDLRDAVNRRHIETLDKAIKHARGSEYENDLIPDIEKAEHLLEHLRRLKGFSHDILELKQPTVSEIRSYNHAQPITYHVMKATCLLLGDKQQDVADWELVKIIIGRLSPSFISRVKKFDFERLTPEIVALCENTIKDYSKESAQTVSAGVGTFYVWSKNVCDEFHRTKS